MCESVSPILKVLKLPLFALPVVIQMLDSGLPIGRCIWTWQGEWRGSAFLGFTFIVSVLQVDSWALGVLLYTLVYGTMPFDGFDHKNLIRQISSGEYREPTQTSGIKKE